MKNLRQVKDLINNLAREKGINPQILLRNYMMERLLERITLSEYHDNFILKGSMLITALVGIDSRSTVDMDTTMKRRSVTLESVRRAFESILVVYIDDGVEMNVIKIDEIRDEAEYSGYRVTIVSKFETAKIPLKVDITAGDAITPKEVHHNYNLLLENRTIEILTYNIEMVLAEKIETIITRGTVNTRMRDFYDIYILQELENETIDKEIFAQALTATATTRGTVHILADGYHILNDVLRSDTMSSLWKRYQKKYSYASDIMWDMIDDSLRQIWYGTKA